MHAINTAFQWARAHKGLTLLIGIGLFVFVMASFQGIMNTQAKRAAQEEATPKQSISPTGQTDEAPELAYTGTRSLDAALLDDTEKTRELIAILKNNAWTTHDESAALTFYDGYFTSSDAGAQKATRYIITYTKTNTQDDTQTTRYTAVMETDKGDFVLDVARVGLSWQCASDAFDYVHYIQQVGELSFSVDDMPPALMSFTKGISTLPIVQVLTGYVCVYYPSASKASWASGVTYQIDTQQCSFVFILDNAAASRISVTYDTATNQAEIKGVMQ
jgi:hypothetical protein